MPRLWSLVAALTAGLVAPSALTAVQPAHADTRLVARASAPPSHEVADSFVYRNGGAGIQPTAWGLRFRSGGRANHLSVTLSGTRLRFADTASSSWVVTDRRTGRTSTQLPSSCTPTKASTGIAALCRVPSSGPVFVEAWTGDGNDVVNTSTLPSRFRTWASPGAGSNTVLTGRADDYVNGGPGRDVVRTHGGNDAVFGGQGDDVLDGGVGNDRIVGGGGNDTLVGEGGGDMLRGNAGRDRVDGGPGADRTGCNDVADTVTADALDVRRAPSVAVPLHRSGAHILDRYNRPYVPYGVTLTELTQPATSTTLATEKTKMRALVGPWCGNTVRIQISQDQLVSGTGYTPLLLGINQTFLQAIKTEVSYARSLGLVVVISLQAERDRDAHQNFMPTQRSLVFWKEMVKQYGTNPGVIFDLFNEPGMNYLGCTKGDWSCVWRHWHDGFTYGGVGYIGMQPLTNKVRAMGAKNVFWVEGPVRGNNLRNVQSYPIVDSGPMAYAIHHPPVPATVASWQNSFGYLVSRGIAPVVVGEWANYSDADPRNSACWDDAPQSAPRFLDYLTAHRIGVIGWKLGKGFLTAGTDPYVPSVMGRDWRCTGANAGVGEHIGQSVGSLLMHWFQERNVPA
jgi:hypothetical protein